MPDVVAAIAGPAHRISIWLGFGIKDADADAKRQIQWLPLCPGPLWTGLGQVSGSEMRQIVIDLLLGNLSNLPQQHTCLRLCPGTI